MQLRTALLCVFAVSACGVSDEVVIEDQPGVLADEESADPRTPLTERVKAAIAALPADDGWPALAEFEAGGVEPFRVVECASTKWGESDAGAMILIEQGEEWIVTAAVSDPSQARFDSAKGLGTQTVLFQSEHGRLQCVSAELETVAGPPDVVSAFAYAKTLVTPEEPVFVEAKVEEYDDALHRRLEALGEDGWSEDDVQELIDIGPPASAEHWGIALAHVQDRPDLAYEIHRRYRPMGYCSQDTRPITTQESFASLCGELGRPRCHLALMKDMLAYHVSRRSDMWIGGKPVTYTSRLDALPPEVDEELFMLGLLADFPGTDGAADASISPQFFALASHGSAIDGALDAALTAWLGDETVDAYNRHRFAVALYFLRTYGDQTKPPAEHASSVAKLAGVPAVTLAQLRAIR